MPDREAPARILVTAFEPFGPPGGPVRPENASETVLRALRERDPARIDSIVLPVDPRCEVALARAFDADPPGVLALGEAGGPGEWDTNVEEVARDLPVGRSPASAQDPGSAVFRSSLFAAGVPLLPGMERGDRIGSYWCNRAYWRVLEWCQLFHRPAVFLHLRVGGDRARQADHAAHVLACMERAAGLLPPAREHRARQQA
jgi:pyrrolidone-carboxylate peptidase